MQLVLYLYFNFLHSLSLRNSLVCFQIQPSLIFLMIRKNFMQVKMDGIYRQTAQYACCLFLLKYPCEYRSTVCVTMKVLMRVFFLFAHSRLLK